jgi:hypothetical protein
MDHLPKVVAFAILAGCGTSEPSYQELRSWNGLSVAVRLLDPRPRIGEPVRVRVEMTNAGSRTMYYDLQNIEWGSFELEGPASAPGIAEHGQSFRQSKPVAPGQTVVLLDRYDLATEYLIDVAGAWRVRFASDVGLSEQERAETARVVLLSDWLEVRIGDGTPAPWMEVARRLHDAKRPGWRLTAYGHGAGVQAILRSPDYALDRPFRSVRLRIGPTPAVENEKRLGTTRWGEAFVFSEWPGLENAWPGWRSDLRAALARP